MKVCTIREFSDDCSYYRKPSEGCSYTVVTRTIPKIKEIRQELRRKCKDVFVVACFPLAKLRISIYDAVKQRLINRSRFRIYNTSEVFSFFSDNCFKQGENLARYSRPIKARVYRPLGKRLHVYATSCNKDI